MPDVIRADFVVPADRPAPAPAEQPAAPAQGIGNVDRLVPDVLIKVNGQPLSKVLRECMHTVEVQQSLKVADMAVLTFDNPGSIVSDSNEVNCGNEVEVELGYMGGRTALFKGEIISLEPNWPVNQSPTCIVRAYDKMHAMRRGRKQRTFTEQKVSDIVNSIASEEGLTPEIEDTAVVAKYILQNNQSNVEILRELARRSQCEIKVDGVNKKLILRKPKSDQGEGKTLTWGKDLKSFYVKMSVANVASKVEVKTWDVAQKKTVVSTVETQHGSLDVSPSILDLAKKFGESKKQITNRPTSDPGEAKAMASAALNEGAMDGVTARATCMGDTELTAGEVIKLDGLGKSWTGKYYITGSTHLYHRASGYSTEIELGRNGIGSTPVTQVVDPPTPPPAESEAPSSIEASVKHEDEAPSGSGEESEEPTSEEETSEAPSDAPEEPAAEEENAVEEESSEEEPAAEEENAVEEESSEEPKEEPAAEEENSVEEESSEEPKDEPAAEEENAVEEESSEEPKDEPAAEEENAVEEESSEEPKDEPAAEEENSVEEESSEEPKDEPAAEEESAVEEESSEEPKEEPAAEEPTTSEEPAPAGEQPQEPPPQDPETPTTSEEPAPAGEQPQEPAAPAPEDPNAPTTSEEEPTPAGQQPAAEEPNAPSEAPGEEQNSETED